MEDTLTIGIHDGHNCGASLAVNGKIVLSFSEERFTRKKNQVGFPFLSIKEILTYYSINDKDIDSYYFSSKFMHQIEYLLNLEDWYKKNYNDQKLEQIKPKYYEKKNI